MLRFVLVGFLASIIAAGCAPQRGTVRDLDHEARWLVLDGFNAAARADMESLLAKLHGDHLLRPVDCSIRHCEYLFLGDASLGELRRDLLAAMGELGLEGDVGRRGRILRVQLLGRRDSVRRPSW